jgi:hypothetical protein
MAKLLLFSGKQKLSRKLAETLVFLAFIYILLSNTAPTLSTGIEVIKQSLTPDTEVFNFHLGQASPLSVIYGYNMLSSHRFILTLSSCCCPQMSPKA